MLLRGIVALYTRQLQFLYDDAQLGLAKLQSHLNADGAEAKHVLETKKQAAKCVLFPIARAPSMAIMRNCSRPVPSPGRRRCSACWTRWSSSS